MAYCADSTIVSGQVNVDNLGQTYGYGADFFKPGVVFDGSYPHGFSRREAMGDYQAINQDVSRGTVGSETYFDGVTFRQVAFNTKGS